MHQRKSRFLGQVVRFDAVADCAWRGSQATWVRADPPGAVIEGWPVSWRGDQVKQEVPYFKAVEKARMEALTEAISGDYLAGDVPPLPGT